MTSENSNKTETNFTRVEMIILFFSIVAILLVIFIGGLTNLWSIKFIEALFDLIKSLAWPAIAIGFSFMYRNEIIGAIRRIQKAGPVEFCPPQELQNDPPKISIPTEVKEVQGHPRTKMMETIEKSLLANLDLHPEKDKISLLVRLLAQSRLETVFERIYSLIFGSQIQGLKALNNGNASLEDAHAFFETYKKTNEEFYSKYGFKGWFGFLVSQELVSQEGTAISITNLGKDFLVYIAVKNLSENKPY